jgi:hypothetical protein
MWEPKNVADFVYNRRSVFQSKDEPDQLICWDFREMRVRLTHYTIWAWNLTSWVIEGSLDGEKWTEIHREMDADFASLDSENGDSDSFAVPNPVECRFIRLTQTHQNRECTNVLRLRGVEFFGTLSGEDFTSMTPGQAQKLRKSPSRVEFPLKDEQSLNGVISHLTSKYFGHVHVKGTVTITSESVMDDSPEHALTNLADLSSGGTFWSKKRRGQWVCWDFHEMRVCPSHYTIRAASLKSWVLEGSLDGGSWAVIDRKTDVPDFPKSEWKTVSFTVSHRAESRFVRLTQTGQNHFGHDALYLCSVEFFGTLSE